MNFKLDENLDPRIGLLLAEGGHDVETVISEGMSGRSDDELYAVCRRECRTLVTLDLDFANPLRFPPEGMMGIVVLRPAMASLPLIRLTAEGALSHIKSGRSRGQLWIVEPGRIRVHDSKRPPGNAEDEV